MDFDCGTDSELFLLVNNLIGLSEQISIERDIPIEASASEVAICEQRIDEIARSAKRHAFAVSKAKPHLDRHIWTKLSRQQCG